jgi:hypothetical protein
MFMLVMKCCATPLLGLLYICSVHPPFYILCASQCVRDLGLQLTFVVNCIQPALVTAPALDLLKQDPLSCFDLFEELLAYHLVQWQEVEWLASTVKCQQHATDTLAALACAGGCGSVDSGQLACISIT